MKLQISAIICALLLVVLVIANSILLSNNIESLLEDAEKIEPSPKSLAEYEALRDDFMRRQRFMSLSVSHDDLTEIENILSELIGAARAEDEESLIIAKSRLEMSLTHLKRLSGINIDSVLCYLKGAIFSK